MANCSLQHIVIFRFSCKDLMKWEKNIKQLLYTDAVKSCLLWRDSLKMHYLLFSLAGWLARVVSDGFFHQNTNSFVPLHLNQPCTCLDFSSQRCTLPFVLGTKIPRRCLRRISRSGKYQTVRAVFAGSLHCNKNGPWSCSTNNTPHSLWKPVFTPVPVNV